MTDKETAKTIVERYLNDKYKIQGGPLVVVDAATVSKPYGWVFFYSTKEWLETRDIKTMVVGNGPIVYDCRSGKIHQLGTATRPEEQIKEWESENWKS